MSSARADHTGRLVSQLLAEDPHLRGVIEEFVGGLDARLHELRRAYEQLDWDLLTGLAHRLKGAGGSYGYPEISRLCVEMEQRFRAHEADEFSTWIAQLAKLNAAARAGLDPEP